MAVLPALASVGDLSAYLQAEPALAPDDPTALLMLRLASGKVRDHCGPQVLSYVADDQVYLTPSEKRVAFVPELPAQRPSLVEVLGTDGVTWSPMASWSFDVETGELTDTTTAWQYNWQRTITPSSWRVTYSHGYQSIPDGLQGVVLDVAARTINTPAGVDLERVGLRQTKYSTAGFTQENEDALAPYVVARLA